MEPERERETPAWAGVGTGIPARSPTTSFPISSFLFSILFMGLIIIKFKEETKGTYERST